MIGLGAIGVTLTYSILRFANFAHGEFVAWGAYACLVIAGLIGAGLGHRDGAARSVLVRLAGAARRRRWRWSSPAVWRLRSTGVLFRRLRQHGNAIIMVMASFGASMALRSLLEFLFSSAPALLQPRYPDRHPARPRRPRHAGPDADARPDRRAGGRHASPDHPHHHRPLHARGRREPALSPPSPASTSPRVIRKTWLIGGALACAAGIIAGITVQIRPFMGFDLLLPMFAAAILGGIGSVPGAVAGGLIVGLAESVAVPFVGAEYRARHRLPAADRRAAGAAGRPLRGRAT